MFYIIKPTRFLSLVLLPLVFFMIPSKSYSQPSAFFILHDKNYDGFISTSDGINEEIFTSILNFDTNQDKKINEEEFKSFEKNHYFYLQDVNNDGVLTEKDEAFRIKDALSYYDKNSNGEISLSEYNKFFEYDFFNKQDKNQDGFIDKSDKLFNITLNNALKADANKDGKLNKDEFNDYVSNKLFYAFNSDDDHVVDLHEIGLGYWVNGDFAKSDKNTDGQLDKNEMKDYDNNKLFFKYDKNKDNIISKNEFSEKEWNISFKKYDINKDEKIDRKEVSICTNLY